MVESRANGDGAARTMARAHPYSTAEAHATTYPVYHSTSTLDRYRMGGQSIGVHINQQVVVVVAILISHRDLV